MPADDRQRLRAELRALGDRRRQVDREREEVAKETRRLLPKAKGVLPVAEVAKLIGLERSSLYQTYRNVA